MRSAILPITHYPLPITHYPLPITHYPLPITHYPFPITHSLLPITHYPQSQTLTIAPENCQTLIAFLISIEFLDDGYVAILEY